VIEMAVKVVNLTPHTVNLYAEGRVITIPPSGVVARVTEEVTTVDTIEIDGVRIPLRVKQLGAEVENLPPPEENTIFITSYLAAQAAWKAGRRDVVSVGDPVRDENGQIKGASSLYINPD
jgi:hypothetical protein